MQRLILATWSLQSCTARHSTACTMQRKLQSLPGVLCSAVCSLGPRGPSSAAPNAAKLGRRPCRGRQGVSRCGQLVQAGAACIAKGVQWRSCRAGSPAMHGVFKCRFAELSLAVHREAARQRWLPHGALQATTLPLPQGQGRRAAVCASAQLWQEVHGRLLKRALTEPRLPEPLHLLLPGLYVLCHLWQMKTALARASMPSSAPAKWCCHGRATRRLALGGMCAYVRHWSVGGC